MCQAVAQAWERMWRTEVHAQGVRKAAKQAALPVLMAGKEGLHAPLAPFGCIAHGCTDPS